MANFKIYLDDIRIPASKDWIVVRNYDDFVSNIRKFGLENIYLISLDHDLADEHYRPSMYDSDGHYSNYYNDGTFKEKTGYECAKFLVQYCLDNKVKMPQINVHSMNPVGGQNIINVINNFYRYINSNLKCTRQYIQTENKYSF